MDPFVAEIRIFPMNFAPKGWAFCNGQLLPLSQNTALFSLLGTTYGGDGKSNFALPNLQGAAPLQQGQLPGGSIYDLGQTGGQVYVTLTTQEIPAHNHPSYAADLGGYYDPKNNIWGIASGQRPAPNVYTSAVPDTPMNQEAFSPSGGGQPHNNMSPYLVFNFCIALQGVYPPRS